MLLECASTYKTLHIGRGLRCHHEILNITINAWYTFNTKVLPLGFI